MIDFKYILRRNVGKASDYVLELRKKQWQRKNNPSRNTRPVFLVGSGRSGTSMLVRHLGKSYEVELFNEDNKKAFSNWYLISHKNTKKIIQESFAPVVLFKPITHTFETDVLLRDYIGSKVIFIFRHYHDVVNSSIIHFGDKQKSTMMRYLNSGFSVFSENQLSKRSREKITQLLSEKESLNDFSAVTWLMYNQFYFDMNLIKNDNVLLVQYEDIVTNPIDNLRRICDFISIDFTPSMKKGIYASSIRKREPPEISSDIEIECTSLYNELVKCKKTSRCSK